MKKMANEAIQNKGDLTGIVKELSKKDYVFRVIYFSKSNENPFLESNRLVLTSNSVDKIFGKYLQEGKTYFEVILENKGKPHYLGLDSKNRTLKLKELHYKNNSEEYKELIDLFKENEWKIDLCDGK